MLLYNAEKSYGQWSEQDLQLAVAAYKNGDYGLNKSAQIYNVPKATLKRHADGKNVHVNLAKSFGRPAVFNANMKQQLVNHLLHLESLFFGFTINDIRKLAYDIAEKFLLIHNFNKEKKIAGKKWFYGFMKRNPQLCLRQPKASSMARAKGFNKKNVMDFFDILEKVVDENKINANTIFNVDESGFTTVQKKTQKVISLKGKRQVGALTSGERGVNTPLKRKCPELEIGAPPGSVVEISDTGYINSELFVTWLKHFHLHVKSTKENPVVILLDGHTTHSKNLDALLFAKENGIVLLQLPGHTTHRLQPLDVAFLKSLGLYYIQAQEKWLRQNYGKTISQFHVSSLLKEAYGRAATVGIAENAFRNASIWPVNRYIFQDHQFIVSDSLNRCPTPEIETEIENGITINNDKTKDAINDSITINDVEQNNNSFTKVLLEVSPIPKTQQYTKSKRSGRGAQKAVVLTSSPYKNDLQEKSLIATRKINNITIKKEKVEKQNTKRNIFDKKNDKSKKKKVGDIPTSKGTKAGVKENWYCPLCRENNQLDMIMCPQCSVWFHEDCLGLQPKDEFLL
ncbi:HTH psq-type domain-containing protein, partial [Aphis craccivora]